MSLERDSVGIMPKPRTSTLEWLIFGACLGATVGLVFAKLELDAGSGCTYGWVVAISPMWIPIAGLAVIIVVGGLIAVIADLLGMIARKLE